MLEGSIEPFIAPEEAACNVVTANSDVTPWQKLHCG